jgi:hypothetical protein
MQKTALNIVRFALVAAGARVIAYGDRSENLDNMKIALRGITLNIDKGVERYRTMSGTILDSATRDYVEQLKSNADKLFAILQRVDPRNPPERLQKIVKDFTLHFQAQVTKLKGIMDRQSLSVALQLCDRLEQSSEALESRMTQRQLQRA